RRYDEDEFETEQARQNLSPLARAALFVLALTPAFIVAGLVFWLAQSDFSIFARLFGGGAGSPFDLTDAPPPVPASAVTTGLIGALALLAGFGSLAFVLWLLLAIWKTRKTVVLAPPRGALAQAVDDSLDELGRERDARTAIIRIYGNFERALARAKSPRRP